MIALSVFWTTLALLSKAAVATFGAALTLSIFGILVATLLLSTIWSAASSVLTH